jgi:hypothetical protein
MFQQFLYFIFVFLFAALNTSDKDNLAYLITAQVIQVIFFIIEIMILLKGGYKDYIKEQSNYVDVTQFVLHTIYFILKLYQRYRSKVTTHEINSARNFDDYILIISSSMSFTIVRKIQHIIKIYKGFGLLSQLVYKSVVEVGYFLVIFIIYLAFFAFELDIL